jgi:hypothetical protein
VSATGINFQACLIDRSSISSLRINSLRAGRKQCTAHFAWRFGTTLPLVVLMNSGEHSSPAHAIALLVGELLPRPAAF